MDSNENRNSLEIDIKRLFSLLVNRLWVILLVGVLLATLAVGYAYMFITPTYAASVQLYVNNTYGESSPGFSSSQIMAAQDLADTYMVILKSRTVLDEVRKTTGLPYTNNQLKGMISASSVNETEVFQVSVVSTNSKHAEQIANAVAEILPGTISSVVDGSSVRVVEYAVENQQPVGPSYKRYLLLGGILGVVLSVAVIVVCDLLDTSINSEEYLTAVYGEVPLLAVIPGAESQKTGYYKGYYETPAKRQPGKQNGGAE